MNILAKNLKKYRLSRNYTQEQAAEALGVSTQTVSRWECATTLPEATHLPNIAQLYCVTVDDLFHEQSVAYDNYAQRLGAVYEATRNVEDFVRADREYQKLLTKNEHTADDLRMYAILHQYMIGYCITRAQTLFDRVLNEGTDSEGEKSWVYWATWRQKASFLSQIGRGQEVIDEFLPRIEAGSTCIDEWITLIHAYRLAGCNAQALELADRCAERFPENAMLHIYAGDICRALKRYDDAFQHYTCARTLEPTWFDSAYAIAECYEELGDYAHAYDAWKGLISDLTARGFDAEVTLPAKRAAACLEQLQK